VSMITSVANPGDPVVILVAEDNNYDRMILQQAFDDLGLNVTLHFVGDGQDLLDYLRRQNAYAAEAYSHSPALVLLDLNMPRMDGQEALKAIRADATLRVIPVVVLSTSDNPKQVGQAYANGVNAFMTKPGPYDEFVKLIGAFANYWLDSVRFPTVPA
jgi:CheY-like chemotaxis protein